MRIAFVRGPFLNPWELQTYSPLISRHSFVGIGANWQLYKGSFESTHVPIQKASVWGASFGHVHPALFILSNRLMSWTLGQSFGLYDLDALTKDADILHPAETFSTMTYQCLQIRRRRPCKVVATIWENLPHMGETHPLRRARKRRALRELDGFLAVTEASRRILLQEGAPEKRVEVISMAVNLSHFTPTPRNPAWTSRWKLEPKEKVVLFIGRWVSEKGIGEILQAIPEVLKTTRVPVRFCFAGAGPSEPLLRMAAKEQSGRIEIVPFIPYEQLPDLHNMADVFVLPSKGAPKWEEQFGYVLAESMACGKTVVTTRSGSIPDVVGDAAVLISPGDASGLASALIHLLASDQERAVWGEKARQHAQKTFDAEKNARRIETFYERVLARST